MDWSLINLQSAKPYYIFTISELYKVEMNAEDKNKEMFKEMYKSALRVSYFRTIQDPQMMKKSKLQLQQYRREAEDKIDEKTFRMMKGFKKYEQSYKVFAKKANVYLQSSGFCCFGKKKPYQAEIMNAKFSIRSGNEIRRFADFNAVSAEVVQKNPYICIKFQGLPNGQEIKFELQDKNQYKKWFDILYEVIHQSLGAQKHHTYLARMYPEFYKYQHILNSEFEAKANTGDLLLFRCTHNAARAQRFLTNSQFDHVGLVLRNEKNQLFIFESTSDEGVGISPWKQLVKYQWYNQCEKICWRPLIIDLANYEVEIIEAFVAKTLGKQYDINLNKLFQFQSKLERNKEEEEKSTYFCSELIARLYKELKLIDGEKSSASYFPIDFSSKGDLKFSRNGVSLGREQIIAFEKNK